MQTTDQPRRALTPGQRDFLRGLCPGEDCLLAPEQTLVFGADSSRLFARPLAVVRPQEVGQVRRLLAWAAQEGMPIYPRGRGTNVVGDCVPEPAGVVLSTLKMDRILEVNPDDFVAVVEPGVVTAELQAHVERLGLFYPPDPASSRISTVGGNISTGAGGLRAVKYGATRDYVLGLEAVLPGGEVIHTGGRTHKNAVGLDLTSLLVGSEGSLAVITKATLKLLPRPQATASLMAGYASLDQALAAAAGVFAAGLLPVAVEFMAEEVLGCLSLVTDVPWPAETRAVLLLKLDGSRAAVEADLTRLREAVEAGGPCFLRQGTGAEEETLWELRRQINPASFRLKPDKLGDDITVPRGRVREVLLGIREIARRFDQTILTFGHLGDGNIHVNIMHDAADPAQKAAAGQAKVEVLDLTLRLRGTLSGEHGVGLTKAPYIDRQLGGRERGLMRALKAVFDPGNILNPGKGF